MVYRNLFCFWKINKKWDSKEETSRTESTNKEYLFLQQEGDILFQIFEILKEIAKKRIYSEEMLQKKVKEKRR